MNKRRAKKIACSYAWSFLCLGLDNEGICEVDNLTQQEKDMLMGALTELVIEMDRRGGRAWSEFIKEKEEGDDSSTR